MKDLTKKENWTPELRYVHRSRLIAGTVFGFLLGNWLWIWPIIYDAYFLPI